jgi:hypothetical protein
VGWLSPEHDLLMELGHIAPQCLEQAAPLRRDTKRLARPCMPGFPDPPEPSVAFHARERGIEGPRAQTVPVLGELLHQPGTPNFVFGRVMEDVDLPDSKSDLTVGGEHLPRNTYTIIVMAVQALAGFAVNRDAD